MHRVHNESITKQEKRAIWDELILDYLSSEKTMKAYAEHHGLRLDHLGYYVASYRKKQAVLQKTISNFIPVATTVSSSQEIRVTNGALSCYFPITTPPAIMSILLKSLGDAC
jgi:hypothetical protein